MSDSDHPEKWRPPAWHPDFGDVALEFAMLQDLAKSLVSGKLVNSVTLEIPEPGLMYLQIIALDGASAEIHSVFGDKRAGGRRYGIFLNLNASNEKEVYANTIDEVIEFLRSDAM